MKSGWVLASTEEMKIRGVLDCVKEKADQWLEVAEKAFAGGRTGRCKPLILEGLKPFGSISEALEEQTRLKAVLDAKSFASRMKEEAFFWRKWNEFNWKDLVQGRESGTEEDGSSERLELLFEGRLMHECGFNYPNQIKIWSDECAKPAEGQFERMQSRLEEETAMCSCETRTCSAGQCHTKDDSLCPEGTACGCGDVTSYGQGVAAGIGTYAAIQTTKASIGFAIAGPAGAASALVFPTCTETISAGVGAWASTKSVCFCTKLDCKWNSDHGMCLLTRDDASNPNPYQHLPLPGMKCILEDATAGAQSCKLDTCREADFVGQKLGRVELEVFNCHRDTFSMLAPSETEDPPLNATERMMQRVLAYEEVYNIQPDTLFPPTEA